MTLRRVLKFLHEVGSAGLMGAAGTHLVLSYLAEGRPTAEMAALRRGILLVTEWVLMPSLLVVLVSGLFAMAAHPPYQRAGWAWIKAATTVLVLEGTLVAVQGPAQTAAAVAAEMAAGDASNAGALPQILRHERGGLFVLLFLSLVNIALAVWRPRLRRQAPKEREAEPDSEEGAGDE